MQISSLDRDVESHLRDLNVRYTRGRRILVTVLAGSDGPRSASELHAEIGPTVPLSSLYRSLTVLEKAGVVVPHFGTKLLTRYELAEWITGHHHHVICASCGAVEDIDIPATHEAGIRRLIEDISALIEFTPVNHTLEIEGRCVRCA